MKMYDAPERFQRLSELITFRFAISGTCDPGYIVNRIAAVSGSGNGQWIFSGDSIPNPMEVAKALQSAYGCNIQKEDLEELCEILRTGELDKDTAIAGMTRFARNVRKEMGSCEEWRMGYLSNVIQLLNDGMNKLETGFLA